MRTDVWRDIRALRAIPTGMAARHDKRGATFRAALRQAEELASAANAAGHASSALPLFYAVEQIGFAISAAQRTDLYPTTHGLKFSLDHRERNILLGCVEPTSEKGTFQATCDALRSSQLAGSAELGALWAANPDLRSIPIPSTYGSWLRPIDHMLGVRVLGAGGPAQDPETVTTTTGGRITLQVPVPGETVAEVEAALQAYPTLRTARGMVAGTDGDTFGQPDDKIVRESYGNEPVPRASVGWPAPAQMSYAEYLRLQDSLFSIVEVDPTYPMNPIPHEIGFALPTVGGDSALHPLMLWWAMLLALSSLVRYHPAAWTAALNPDSSELAVYLEQLLDVAETRVPERMLRALR
jgi:hypothetical protein